MNTSVADPTNPRFPPELEREIFEIAAFLHPTTIPKLLCVARRVLSWIEPTLYNVIGVGGLEKRCASDLAILRAIDTRPHLFPDAVQNMFLLPVYMSFFAAQRSEDAWWDSELDKLLRACTRVVNLFLIGNPATPLLHAMLEMRPRHLCLFVSVPDQALDLALPFFQHLTHFLLGDSYGPDGSVPLDELQLHNLCRLPALTHLALFDGSSSPMFDEILGSCRSLRALLILCANARAAKAFARDASPRDERVVVLGDENPREDWYAATRGGQDMWARADIFIARKRRGEIDGEF